MMSEGLTMFPESFDKFIEQYQTKEPKFGDYYIPALKVRQALEHYAAAANEKGISLTDALAQDPTYVMTLALKEVIANCTNLIIENIYSSQNSSLNSISSLVSEAITKQLEDQTNHPEEGLKLWNGATL